MTSARSSGRKRNRTTAQPLGASSVAWGNAPSACSSRNCCHVTTLIPRRWIESAASSENRKLVSACQARARERREKQLLAVTSEVMFFECCGFKTFFGERIALFFDIPMG